MKNLNFDITLTNTFRRSYSQDYEIDNLAVQVTLDSDEELLCENLSLKVALQQEEFDTFNNANSPFKLLLTPEEGLVPVITFPFLIRKFSSHTFSIPITVLEKHFESLMDAIRSAPDRVLIYDPTLILYIEIDINRGMKNERSWNKEVSIANPFFGRYQYATDTFNDPASAVAGGMELTVEEGRDLLKDALLQVSVRLEEALLELFELHKEELAALGKNVDGICYDIMPHQRYAAVSFRQPDDYIDIDYKYSSADWENYSLLNYRYSRSEKFRQFSIFLFQLFNEIWASTVIQWGDYNEIEENINHCLYIAIAKAVVQPSVAAKLRDCGLHHAPTIKNHFTSEGIEYIVAPGEDTADVVNYCELVANGRKIKESDERLILFRF